MDQTGRMIQWVSGLQIKAAWHNRRLCVVSVCAHNRHGPQIHENSPLLNRQSAASVPPSYTTLSSRQESFCELLFLIWTFVLGPERTVALQSVTFSCQPQRWRCVRAVGGERLWVRVCAPPEDVNTSRRTEEATRAASGDVLPANWLLLAITVETWASEESSATS